MLPLMRGGPRPAEQALQLVSAVVDADDPSTVTATFSKPVRAFDLQGLSLSFSSGTVKSLTNVWGTAGTQVRLRTDAPIEAGDVFDLQVAAQNAIEAFGDNSASIKTASLPDVATAAEATHWVDPVNGSDTADGSSGTPWASVAHARANAGSGAVIALRDGSYGVYDESAPPSIAEAQTLVADDGHTPTFDHFFVDYTTKQDCKLIVNGLTVVGPGGDYEVVLTRRATNIRLHGMDVSAVKWSTDGRDTLGFSVLFCDGAVVDHNKLHRIARGIQISDCVNSPWVVHNYLQCTAGSFIQWRAGNDGGLVAYNYGHGVDYDPSDPDAPADPHHSFISIRSSNFTVYGNHFHSSGNTSGFMTYADVIGPDRFDNITIENNILYDTDNGQSIRLNAVGNGIVLRNNLVWRGLRSGSCADGTTPNHAQYHYISVVVHSLVADSNGLEIYNNALVGGTMMSEIGSVNAEANNYVWSWQDDTGYVGQSPSGTSTIIEDSVSSCDFAKNQHFQDGSFFRELIDAWFPTRERINLRYADGSPAWNFGNPAEQSLGSIGTIGEDGFMLMDGPARDSSRHSVGPYEAGVESMGAATVAVENQI